MIGLYLNPPQHAVVFSVDEKTAIQALDRKDPVLPPQTSKAEALLLAERLRCGVADRPFAWQDGGQKSGL